jgi:hypothetical protein
MPRIIMAIIAVHINAPNSQPAPTVPVATRAMAITSIGMQTRDDRGLTDEDAPGPFTALMLTVGHVGIRASDFMTAPARAGPPAGRRRTSHIPDPPHPTLVPPVPGCPRPALPGAARSRGQGPTEGHPAGPGLDRGENGAILSLAETNQKTQKQPLMR